MVDIRQVETRGTFVHGPFRITVPTFHLMTTALLHAVMTTLSTRELVKHGHNSLPQEVDCRLGQLFEPSHKSRSPSGQTRLYETNQSFALRSNITWRQGLSSGEGVWYIQRVERTHPARIGTKDGRVIQVHGRNLHSALGERVGSAPCVVACGPCLGHIASSLGVISKYGCLHGQRILFRVVAFAVEHTGHFFISPVTHNLIGKRRRAVENGLPTEHQKVIGRLQTLCLPRMVPKSTGDSR